MLLPKSSSAVLTSIGQIHRLVETDR